MNFSHQDLDEQGESGETVSAEKLKSTLRRLISEWATSHPGRILMRVPVSELEPLAEYDKSILLSALTDLEGYCGAALRDTGTPTPIPWNYELYPTADAVEVLLIDDGMTEKPIERLVEEVTFLARSVAESVPVNELFPFTLPHSVLERRDKLEATQRAQFRSLLNEYFYVAGLFILSGTVGSGLEIRRNR